MELKRQKNIATYIVFPLTDISGNAVEAATNPDSEIDSFSDEAVPDGFVDCINEAVAVGSGAYYLSLTQAEMNADYIYVTIKSDNAVSQHILIHTIANDPAVALATSGNVAVVGVEVNQASGAIAIPNDYKAVGFSTHNPAAVWSEGGRTLTTPADYKANVASLALEATVSGIWSLPSRALTTPNDYKADVSSLATSGMIAPLQVDLDTPDQYKADVSLLALETTASGIWNLPSRELSTPANYKADVSTLATESNATTNKNNIVTGVWDLPVKSLSTPNDYKADVSLLSLEATVSGVWSLSSRELSTPADYKAIITGLALETTVNALNDPTTKEIDDYLTGLHGAGSWEGGGAAPTTKEINDYLTGDHGAGNWEGGGAAPTTGEIATGVWGYVSKALTTPADYMANVTGINDLSGYIATIQTDLDTPSQYKANVTELANISGYIQPMAIEVTQSSGAVAVFNNYKADVTELSNISGYIAPVQLDLDTPSQYMAVITGLSLDGEYDSVISGIQAEVDKYDNYKADVTGINDISGYIATVDVNVDSVKTKTDNLPDDTSGQIVIVQGLLHKNIYTTAYWDGDDMTGAQVRIYDSAFNAGVHSASGVLLTLGLTGVSVSGKTQTILVIEE